jgi:hypothetical protein
MNKYTEQCVERIRGGEVIEMGTASWYLTAEDMVTEIDSLRAELAGQRERAEAAERERDVARRLAQQEYHHRMRAEQAVSPPPADAGEAADDPVRSALEHHGLWDEFGHLGCDAVDWLCTRLLEARAELAGQRERAEKAEAATLRASEATEMTMAKLREATKAGTAYWHERDTMNALVIENQRLRNQLAASPPPADPDAPEPWTPGVGERVRHRSKREIGIVESGPHPGVFDPGPYIDVRVGVIVTTWDVANIEPAPAAPAGPEEGAVRPA